MLFSYSPIGYQDNWLHDILLEMLTNDMERVDGGLPRIDWPDCISEDKREVLKPKHGLKTRRAALLDCYAELAAADRADVRAAMVRHNAIPEVLEDGLPCASLSDLPASIRHSIKAFFEFAFGLLTDLELRDNNYKQLYDQLDYKVCAFCGVELLDAPGQRREALDHYLPIAEFPFAGANFRNLSPMGTKCNSRYKLQQNILFDPATGNRRACCDPYDSPTVSLSLNNSQPFAGQRVDLVTCPAWVIEWQGGDAQKLQTWEAVFAISERYRESSLNPNFRSWIDHFCRWAARQENAANNPDLLRSLLIEFAEIIVPEGFAEAAFLKRATFEMLANHCNATANGIRLFEWLYGQIAECRVLAA